MSDYNPVIRIAKKLFQNDEEVRSSNLNEEDGGREMKSNNTSIQTAGDSEGSRGLPRGRMDAIPRSNRMFNRFIKNNDEGGDGRTREEIHRDMTRTIFELLQKRGRKSKYYSFVVKRENRMQDEAVYSLVFYGANNSVFKWVTEHGDHLHIIHDCSYSNGSCRCFGKQLIGYRSSRIYNTSELGEEDRGAIITYHFPAQRKVHHALIGDTDFTRVLNRLKDILSELGNEGEMGDQRHVEVCRHEDEILWQHDDGSEPDSACETNSEDITSKNSEKRKSRKRRAQEKTQQEIIEELILQIGKVPLQDSITSDKYLSSFIRFTNTLSVPVKNALHTVKLN